MEIVQELPILQAFEHEKFGRIRIIMINGVPWFAGKDIAQILDYKDTDKAVRRHVDDKDKQFVKTARHNAPVKNSNTAQSVEDAGYRLSNYGMIFINESGVYSLILGSKLEAAQEFRHWLTSEVLPALFRTGVYAMKAAEPAPEKPKASSSLAILERKCVYIFELSNHTVKIGCTKNVQQRLNNISSNSGMEVVNVYVTEFIDAETASSIEQACQEAFADRRTKGEFFNITFEEACNEIGKYADKIFDANEEFIEDTKPIQKFKPSAADVLSIHEQINIFMECARMTNSDELRDKLIKKIANLFDA